MDGAWLDRARRSGGMAYCRCPLSLMDRHDSVVGQGAPRQHHNGWRFVRVRRYRTRAEAECVPSGCRALGLTQREVLTLLVGAASFRRYGAGSARRSGPSPSEHHIGPSYPRSKRAPASTPDVSQRTKLHNCRVVRRQRPAPGPDATFHWGWLLGMRVSPGGWIRPSLHRTGGRPRSVERHRPGPRTDDTGRRRNGATSTAAEAASSRAADPVRIPEANH